MQKHLHTALAKRFLLHLQRDKAHDLEEVLAYLNSRNEIKQFNKENLLKFYTDLFLPADFEEMTLKFISQNVQSGESFATKFVARLALIPVIAALSYEILKFSAKRRENPVIAAIIYPGLMVQKLTTREPSLKQLHIAILALKGVLPK